MVPGPDRLERALKRASSTARRAFASDDLYLERYVPDARHVEVQVFGDGHGTLLHMYERECSVQRRHQKLIEETPSPGLPEETRIAMTDAALTAAKGIGGPASASACTWCASSPPPTAGTCGCATTVARCSR